MKLLNKIRNIFCCSLNKFLLIFFYVKYVTVPLGVLIYSVHDAHIVYMMRQNVKRC